MPDAKDVASAALGVVMAVTGLTADVAAAKCEASNSNSQTCQQAQTASIATKAGDAIEAGRRKD